MRQLGEINKWTEIEKERKKRELERGGGREREGKR